MKILILGASGEVGKPIFSLLSEKHDVYGTYKKNKPADLCAGKLYHFDITNYNELNKILENINPDLIISSLTGNFEEQIETHRILEKFLRENNKRIIFISTANVFDGDVRGGHPEEATPCPISNYGRFKQACEEMLLAGLGENCLIIRLPKILSKWSAEKWFKSQEKGFGNLYFSFNTADNVSRAICYCVEGGKNGILHLTSTDNISLEDSMKLFFTKKGIQADYMAEQLTIENYCDILGCDSPEFLRHNFDNRFDLSLICSDDEISSRFGLTCEECINSVI